MAESVVPARPAVEVADVIRGHGEAFVHKYGKHLTTAQKKALRDLARCRTAELGGHVERCLDCGRERIAYNSCRNRNCPKCQALSRQRWLERESGYLLPVEYHHVVFTLPVEMSALASANAAALYDLLMSSAAQTLREVAANPQRLGARLGALMVLHTWRQNLHLHPHVHCVVTGGGLSCDAEVEVDASPRWVSCRPGFFLPVRALSRLFRGKFLAGLRALHTEGKLKLPSRLQEGSSFLAWLSPLYAKDLVVYAKPPFGGPAQVLMYLARYTHRVAISNHRLVKLEDGQVTFRYHDYAEDRKEKLLTLSGEEFLRRFMTHVLPKGFLKIRHDGLLASRQREANLHLSRQLLLAVMVLTACTTGTSSAGSTEVPMAKCPHCGGSRLLRCPLPQMESLSRRKPETGIPPSIPNTS
jgi:hypothetical protein